MRHTRLARCAIPAVLWFAACTSGTSGDTDTSEAFFVGGWDGAQTRGTSVLLLREGLSGTLSGAVIGDDHEEIMLTYAAEGVVEYADVGMILVLELGCEEAFTRSLVRDGNPDEDIADAWTPLDCGDWDLQLQCSLAGSCEGTRCNLVCDVSYFGDGYARAGIPLADIEDEFDYWRRA